MLEKEERFSAQLVWTSSAFRVGHTNRIGSSLSRVAWSLVVIKGTHFLTGLSSCYSFCSCDDPTTQRHSSIGRYTCRICQIQVSALSDCCFQLPLLCIDFYNIRCWQSLSRYIPIISSSIQHPSHEEFWTNGRTDCACPCSASIKNKAYKPCGRGTGQCLLRTRQLIRYDTCTRSANRLEEPSLICPL